MLMAFDVIKTLTTAEVVTAVTLVLYVAVNEVVVRPGRHRAPRRAAQGVEAVTAGPTPPPPET